MLNVCNVYLDIRGDKEEQLCSDSDSPIHDNWKYIMENAQCFSVSESSVHETMQSQEDVINKLLITCLPEVALVNILEYLTLKDRYRLSLTCRLFHELFSHPHLWRVAHISLFAQSNPQESSTVRWGLKSIMHQTMAEIVRRFSHLFQHLSLEMYHHVQPFDDGCRKMLEDFNKDCRLESLSIRLGALASNDQFVQRTSARSSNFNDLPLVVGLIRKTVRLKRLNIISWPLHSEVESKIDIFQALMSTEKLKGLESLSIFYVATESESWTERNPKLPSIETTLELVSYFKNLTYLSLRSPMLSNKIIMELASTKRSKLRLFQVLIVYSRDSIVKEGYKLPDISSQAWKALKISSPGLQVEYLILTRIPQEQLNLMLSPEVPLSSLTILNYGRCDQELIDILIEKYSSTLQNFICLCDSANCDKALINLVTYCTRLQHLTFHGDVHHRAIVKMAEILKKTGQKFNCFEFKEKTIRTVNSASEDGRDDNVVVAKDAEEDEYYLVGVRSWHQDENERKCILSLMIENVSQALGHKWQPVI